MWVWGGAILYTYCTWNCRYWSLHCKQPEFSVKLLIRASLIIMQGVFFDYPLCATARVWEYSCSGMDFRNLYLKQLSCSGKTACMSVDNVKWTPDIYCSLCMELEGIHIYDYKYYILKVLLCIFQNIPLWHRYIALPFCCYGSYWMFLYAVIVLQWSCSVWEF